MRGPASITIFLCVLVVAGVIHIAHDYHKDIQKIESERVKNYHERLWEQCKLMIPDSPANQRNCFEESK